MGARVIDFSIISEMKILKSRHKYDIEKLDRGKNTGKGRYSLLSKDASEVTEGGCKRLFGIPVVSSFDVHKDTPISTSWCANRRSIRTAGGIANVSKIADKIEGYKGDVTGVRSNFLTDFRNKLLHIFKKYNAIGEIEKFMKRV